MSETAVTLEFGDATYRFWLPMTQIVAIERLCGGKSIVTMFDELGATLGLTKDATDPVFLGGGGPVHIKDCYEIVRCAAQGGGECERHGEVHKVSSLDAKSLADQFVDGRPYEEFVPVAWAILNATIMGVSLKKKEVRKPAAAPTRHSPKVRSTPTAASSD